MIYSHENIPQKSYKGVLTEAMKGGKIQLPATSYQLPAIFISSRCKISCNITKISVSHVDVGINTSCLVLRVSIKRGVFYA